MPIDPTVIAEAGALVAAVVLAAVAGALVARLLIRASSGASARDPSPRGGRRRAPAAGGPPKRVRPSDQAGVRVRTRALLAIGVVGVLAIACVPGAAAPSAAPKPAYCAAAQSAALQEITETPASPYFVHHPAPQRVRAPTVVFLPGGSGLRRNAQRVWDTFLAGAKDVDAFRVVVPYWPDIEMPEGFRRTPAVVDEVLACYGGDEGKVHLAGFSNGGHAAFELMLEQPQRFATLLGAPGEFPPGTTPAEFAALKGKAVFNGVGELDDEFWHKGVRDAHDALARVGVDSVYVEFKGQRHGAGVGFPKDLLFEFWAKHSTLERR